MRSLPHGHVTAVLGLLRDLRLERLISRERCRERDLVVAMICQRLLDPCLKLSTTRLVHQMTFAQKLELGEVTETELLAAMDWLYGRQEQIEAALARRHLQGEGYVLYDLSSSYLEDAVVSLPRSAIRAMASLASRRSATGCAARPRGSLSRSRCTLVTPGTRRPCHPQSSGSRTGSGSSTWCLSAGARSGVMNPTPCSLSTLTLASVIIP